jgi:phage tail-like protein
MAAPPSPQEHYMAVVREDPYPASSFQVTIQGVLDDGRSVRGSFAEVSGLEVTITPIEYRNGSEDITVRKLPGLKKFTNITLKRGAIGDLTLWQWIKTVMDGRAQRADGTITLLDESRQPVMVWKFRRAWPCKWSGPSLNAKSNDVAIESIEICHEGLDLE